MEHGIKEFLLRRYIKQVSDIYGGDEESFLNEYTGQVIKEHEGRLDDAIECFKDVYDRKVSDNDRKK